MYLESSLKTQVKLVHPHDPVLGVTVLVFTGTFTSLFQKRLESDSLVELCLYCKVLYTFQLDVPVFDLCHCLPKMF